MPNILNCSENYKSNEKEKKNIHIFLIQNSKIMYKNKIEMKKKIKCVLEIRRNCVLPLYNVHRLMKMCKYFYEECLFADNLEHKTQ